MDTITIIASSHDVADTGNGRAPSRWERVLNRAGCICIVALFVGLAILIAVPVLAVIAIAGMIGLTALGMMALVNWVRVRFGGKALSSLEPARDNVRIRLEGEP